MKKVFNDLYVTHRQFIIFALFFIYCFCGIISTSTLSINSLYRLFTNGLELIVAIGLFLYILIDIITKRQKLNLFLLIGSIVSVVVVICANNTILCYLIAFIILFREYKFDNVVKCFLYACLVTLSMVVILAVLNFIENPIFHRGDVVRYSLGFESATIPQALLLFIILAYNYLKKEKINFIVLLVESISIFVCYNLTDTRATFMLALVVICVSLILKIDNILKNKYKLTDKKQKYNVISKRNKVSSLLIALIPLFSVFFFGLLVYLFQFQSNFILKINELLSSRLEFTYNAFISNKITLFGSVNYWFNDIGEYIGVDSAFYNYLFNLGIVPTLLILFVFSAALYKSCLNKNYWLSFALLIITANSFVEAFLFDPRFNVFILSFASLILNSTYNEQKSLVTEQNQKHVGGMDDADLNTKLRDKKLSIIVPVFNGQKYIAKCLDKLLDSKLENKEIIVIDDCSTDKTNEILKKYKSDVMIISLKENKGVSNARNIGLKESTGDYIAFVDSDDDFEKDIHEKMLKSIISQDADVCVCEYNEIYENSSKIVDSKYSLSMGILNSKEGIRSYLVDKISPAVWDKIYKKEILLNHKFDNDLRIGEDILFCLKVFMRANKVSFVKEVLYHYLQQEKSAMHTVSDKLLQFSSVLTKIGTKETNELKTNFQQEFDYFESEMILRSIHSISVQVNKQNKSSVIELLKKVCTKENIKKILKTKLLSKSLKLEALIIKVFGIKFHLFLMPVYLKIRDKR